MILTVEDRRSPALKITADHFMYIPFQLQINYARQQARRLDLGGLPRQPTIAALTENDIEHFLTRLGMKDLSDPLKS